MPPTITERLTKILKETGFDPDFTQSPVQLGMDSMDYVEFGMMLEQDFDITIANEDLFTLRKKPLSDWVDYIDKQIFVQ